MSQSLDLNQRVIIVRDKGRVTIPALFREKYGLEEGAELVLAEEEGRLVLYPRRKERLEVLLDQIGQALAERRVTLSSLLENHAAIRREIFREKYPELAEEYDL